MPTDPTTPREAAIAAAARILVDAALAAVDGDAGKLCSACLRPAGWRGTHAGDEHDGCECPECVAACWDGAHGIDDLADEARRLLTEARAAEAIGRWPGGTP